MGPDPTVATVGKMTGKISEIFESIQGEGIYWGSKQIFVRFSGCNLRCSYCDTLIETFSEYAIEELIGRIKSFGRNFHSVSFTGGEPLFQKDFLSEALKMTKQEGYKTYLETNGTLPNELKQVIDNVDIVAMDIKLPSSTGSVSHYWDEHRDFLKTANKGEVFIKAVISLSTTKDDIFKMAELLKNLQYEGVMVLQPNSFDNALLLKEKLGEFKKTCEKYVADVRVIPQMHRLIGVK